MITVIFTHPWHGSFNKGIFDAVVSGLEKRQTQYRVIDLYRDGFNPVMTEKELAKFSKGEYADPLVGEYHDALKKTTELIVIFPIWWNSVPAMLKGFWDKVMLKGFAYEETAMGLKGLLSNIQKVTIITTGGAPRWYLRFVSGNPMKSLLFNFKSIGVHKSTWIHSADIKPDAAQKRASFLNKIEHGDY